MRLCKKCTIEKHESCFERQSKIKDGISHVCKACKSVYRRKYREKIEK